MDRDFVKDQLTKLGYKDLTDELIDEFLEKLQEDDQLPIIPTIPKRFSTKRYQNEILTQKRSSSRSKTTKSVNIEKNIHKKEKIVSKDIKTNMKSSKIAHLHQETEIYSEKNSSKDNEIHQWSQKLKAINKKGKKLDSDILQCKLAITSPCEEIIDVPIYYGPNADYQRDPYPVVSIKKSGGFIRPPPIKGIRKHIHPNGHKLTYAERFPYYLPAPERRRDELRWKIRQKLIYSDPKYH